jgi:hypothetical protein
MTVETPGIAPQIMPRTDADMAMNIILNVKRSPMAPQIASTIASSRYIPKPGRTSLNNILKLSE